MNIDSVVRLVVLNYREFDGGASWGATFEARFARTSG
jgi:hypothetical protein